MKIFAIILACGTLIAPATVHSAETLAAKRAAIERVFDDLVRAIGPGGLRPHLQIQARTISDSQHQIAWYDPRTTTITVEERLYDRFRTLDADSTNALAYVLGHELAHASLRHLWLAQHFGAQMQDLPHSSAIAFLHQTTAFSMQVEVQADLFGGFYAQMAGYQSLTAAGRTLDAIYAEYHITGAGYPPLAERQAIADSAAAYLQKLLPVFKAGTYLQLIKRHHQSARCFDYISNSGAFASREILNNAGTARVLAALDLTAPTRFAYPLEFDGVTRLARGPTRGPGQDTAAQRQRLLRQAWDLFQEATRKDTLYAPAYVNLVSTAQLRGQQKEALAAAEKAIAVAGAIQDPISLANAHIALGIAVAGQDTATARQNFARALAGNAGLAKLNLAALDPSYPQPIRPLPGEKRSPHRETPLGTGTDINRQIRTAPDIVVQYPLTAQGADAALFGKQKNGSYGLIFATPDSTYTFIEIGADYTGTSGRGIRVGDTLRRLQEKYGEPAYIEASKQGAYHAYVRRESRIIFLVGANERVLGWVLFAVDGTR